MTISPVRRVVVCAGIDRARRAIARIGLPLCLGLYATSTWSLDVNCSGCVDATDISGRAVTIICPRDSIQSAIDTADPVDQLNIIIDGTCTEDITVARDRVTFEGSTNGGELKGTLSIIGARGIRMTNLSITGPLD